MLCLKPKSLLLLKRQQWQQREQEFYAAGIERSDRPNKSSDHSATPIQGN